MAARPAVFRQADISRAIKAAKAAGFEIGRLEISRDGNIVMMPLVAESQSPNDELEEWEKTYNARKA